MVFVSLQTSYKVEYVIQLNDVFMAFFPLTFLVYLLIKPNYQNMLLVIASLIFYAWGEPVYVFLMLISVLINYILGIAIEKYSTQKKCILVISIVYNLLILGFFKYYGFLTNSLNSFFGKPVLPDLEIALPIGISFFTFQIMSYIIDLYRGQYRAQRNIVNLALYISFFPQLIAGPIVKYKDINDQIEKRTISVDRVVSGFRRFVYGLGKKVIISNILAECVDSIYALNITEIGTLMAWGGCCFIYLANLL